MGVIPGAFEQAFELQRSMQEDELSDVEDETSPESWANVMFSKEEKVRMRAPWSAAIIVKTYGRNIGFSYLSSRIRSLWKPSGKLDCIDLGHDFFLIKFDCQNDLENVLKGGPWFIGQQFLAIRQWEPGFKASSASLSSVAVWIRLPELPIEYYEPSALLKIGQAIGPILRIDAHMASNVRGRFARICVQVNLDKPLIYSIQIGKMVQKVQYEGLNSLCFDCGRMGHRKKSCTYTIKEQPGKDSQQSCPVNVSPSQDSAEANLCSTSADKPTSPSSTSSDKMYGEWMVVSRRKGKARQAPRSVPLENVSGNVVTSKVTNITVEPFADVQTSHSEGKRKILGPTIKTVIVPVDKSRKANPKKSGNGKFVSSKGRSAFSNGNPNQAFSVNPQIFSNNPSEAFNFSAGANISPAQPSSSSFHSIQTSPTHPFSPHNHEPISGALGNVLPKQDNPFGGQYNQYDSQGPYPHHGVV